MCGVEESSLGDVNLFTFRLNFTASFLWYWPTKNTFAKKDSVYSKEEKKQLIVDFWTGFSDYCFEHRYLNSWKKKWILHKTKVSNVHFKFDTGREGVQVILEIQHKSEKERLAMFERIEACKNMLEQGFEEGLIWDFLYQRDNGKQVCRIYTQLNGVDLHKQSQWQEMYDFMAKNMKQFEINFLEIRDILVE